MKKSKETPQNPDQEVTLAQEEITQPSDVQVADTEFAIPADPDPGRRRHGFQQHLRGIQQSAAAKLEP